MDLVQNGFYTRPVAPLQGSFVRGEQTGESDVDLLVTFSETPDLLEFVNLKRYLEDVCRVTGELK